MSVKQSSAVPAFQELQIQTGPGKCPPGEASPASQEVDQKSKSYLYKDIYSSMIQSDDNLETAQLPNKRRLVKQTLFYQIEEILLCH